MSSNAAVKILSCAPRGLRRLAAAEYIGVSPAHFDVMVSSGIMPQPKVSGACVIWDRLELDEAFSLLPVKGKPKKSTASAWEAFQR